MADETNGKTAGTDEEPSESDSTEVKSPIVMRIDAPEAEPPEAEEPAPRLFSSQAFSSISRGFPPLRPSPSSSGGCFGSVAQFCHSTANSRSVAAAASSSSGGAGGAAKTTLLLRPSQLAVASNEVTNSDAADQRIGSTTGSHEADGNSEPTPASDVSAPKFVPLGASLHPKEDNCAVGNSGVSSSASSFVFGQNLHARASAVAVETPDSTSGRLAQPLTDSSEAATSNGTSASEMLFTSVIKCDPVIADNGAAGSADAKSLSEAAAEYEESRSKKRKYEEVSLFTGEEGEINVAQINCRLYIFDNTSGQYMERGRGTLRVNDSPGGAQSRVLMRATGSLRVVLNTKIWSGMSVGRPSPKSIRLTAMETSGQVKVFLVMASMKEIDTLHRLIVPRITRSEAGAAKPAPESGDDAPPPEEQDKRREVQGGDEEDL